MEVVVKTNPYANQENGKMGVANVTFGEVFKARSMNILKGRNDELFVSMPSIKTNLTDEHGNPEYRDVCYPTTKEFREQLNEKIISAYREAKDIVMDAADDKAERSGKETEKAPKEKASIRGKIKDGQEKVASTVPKPTENAKTAQER